MNNGERLYRGAVRGISLVFIAIGLLVLVRTLAHGGGPSSLGILMGIIFLAIGGARLWLGARMER